MKKLILSTLASLAILVGVSGTSFAANPASFSLSPASGSVNNGSSFSVGIYENGDNANVVTVNLTYDTTKLQLTGESCGGAFSTTASQSGSTITCFVPGGSAAVSGSQLAVNASFKAIANGSAAVGFGSGSVIASGGANVWGGNTSGGTFTISTPASQPSNPSQPSGGSSSSTGSTGSTSSSTGSSASKSTGNTSSSSNSGNSGSSTSKGNITTSNSGKVAAASTKAGTKTSTTKKAKFADAIAQPTHTVRNVAVATSLLIALIAAGLIWVIRDGKKLSLSFAKFGKK